VNFLGPNDEYVASGSDDGNFFIWRKDTTKVLGIWEGDGGVVNVVEDRPAHHSYPMLAVSGLDHTVKLFSPTSGPHRFSRVGRLDQIVRENSNRTVGARLTSFHLAMLYSQMRRSGGEADPECRFM